MDTICGETHPELKVDCGLPLGHPTDHYAKIGSVAIVWPNSQPDEARVGKAVVLLVTGLFAVGAILAVACLVVSAAG